MRGQVLARLERADREHVVAVGARARRGANSGSTAFGMTRIFSARDAEELASSDAVNSETAIDARAARRTRGNERGCSAASSG